VHGQKLERKCTVPARTARSSEHAASAGDAGVARGTDCVCYAHQPATLTNVDACGVIQQATPACVPREHAPATQAAETTSDSLRCARARRLQAGPKGLQTGTAPSRDSPTRSALHPKSRARRLPAGPSPKRITDSDRHCPIRRLPDPFRSHPICERTRARFHTHKHAPAIPAGVGGGALRYDASSGSAAADATQTKPVAKAMRALGAAGARQARLPRGAASVTASQSPQVTQAVAGTREVWGEQAAQAAQAARAPHRQQRRGVTQTNDASGTSGTSGNSNISSARQAAAEYATRAEQMTIMLTRVMQAAWVMQSTQADKVA